MKRKAIPLRFVALAVAVLALAQPAEALRETTGYDLDAAALAVEPAAPSRAPARGLHRAPSNSWALDDGHVLQEADGSVPAHPGYRRYHYGYGPLSVVDSTGKRFIQTDALGSPTDLTSTSGAIASVRKYDAWGSYRDATAPSESDEKLGYTGHQYDPETGLVYARARYYDPEVGAFISRDTYEGKVEDAPSLHRYMYAQGNPLTFVDPEGRCAVNPDGTVDCMAEARARQAEIAAAAQQAFADGRYGDWALGTGLGILDAANYYAAFASQMLLDGSLNAGINTGGGFVSGDYDRALKGLVPLLLLGTADKAVKAAQWVEEAALPAVRRAGTQISEKIGKVLGSEEGAAANATNAAVESAAAPGPALVSEPALAAPQRRSLGAAAADDPALGPPQPASRPVQAPKAAEPSTENLAAAATPSQITDPKRLLAPPRESNPWAGDTVSEVVGPEGRYAYRVHGAENGGRGAWLSEIEPPDEAYVRGPLAVLPSWNDATHVSRVAIAPGSRIQVGVVGSQGPGFEGGGGQIRVLNRSDIAREVVDWTKPLPRRR